MVARLPYDCNSIVVNVGYFMKLFFDFSMLAGWPGGGGKRSESVLLKNPESQTYWRPPGCNAVRLTLTPAGILAATAALTCSF